MNPSNQELNPKHIDTDSKKKEKFSGGLVTIISVALFILFSLGVIIFLFNQNQMLKEKLAKYQEGSSTPIVTDSPLPSASPEAVLEQGTVTGKLCYPSEFLPSGEIVAKNLSTNETYTQKYLGTSVGGGSTYSFELPPGDYHLRYQAHTNSQEPDVFTSGYYTACAKDSSADICSLNTNHENLKITVTDGQETTGIDLCDFYYDQNQEKLLEQSF